MKHTFPVAVLALASATSAQSPQPICYDFAPVDQIVTEMVRDVARRGAVLTLHKEGVDLYAEPFGGFDLDEVVPIASATKWLTAVCLMTIVDDGLLNLESQAGTYLPSYTGQHAVMTLRQMLSHTSGMPGGDAVIGDLSLTLEQAVDQLGAIPLLAPPGTQFYYGGASMQVAGRIAEIVTGQSWATLFAERVAGPLEMTDTDYDGLGVTQNPRIGGGAQSSVSDYGKLVRMLLNRGIHHGSSGPVRILSEFAVAEILRDQTNGVPIVSTPADDDRRYGLGCWMDRVDSANVTRQASSQGAFGFSPWIDFDRGLVGVLLVNSLRRAIQPDLDRVQDWIADNIHWQGVRCFGAPSPACASSIVFTSNGPARSGNAAFAFELSGLAPRALGALLLADMPVVAGPLPLLGFDLYLSPLGSITSVPVAAQLDGTATIPASLTTTPAGGPTVFVQTLWVQPCAPRGLAASAALAIDVR